MNIAARKAICKEQSLHYWTAKALARGNRTQRVPEKFVPEFYPEENNRGISVTRDNSNGLQDFTDT